MRINKKLLAHGTYVMYTLGMLVDHLEQPEMLHQMLKRLARNHYRRRVNLTAFELLRDTFLQHLTDVLGTQVCTKQCLVAWNKTFGLILTVLDEEFTVLESDMQRSGSYYQLNRLHRSAKQELMQAQTNQYRNLLAAYREMQLTNSSKTNSLRSTQSTSTLNSMMNKQPCATTTVQDKSVLKDAKKSLFKRILFYRKKSKSWN